MAPRSLYDIARHLSREECEAIASASWASATPTRAASP
jgi:hypothetical protein